MANNEIEHFGKIFSLTVSKMYLKVDIIKSTKTVKQNKGIRWPHTLCGTILHSELLFKATQFDVVQPH